MSAVLERLLRYVQYDTQSDDTSPTYPSTAKQRVLLEALRDELQQMGLLTIDSEWIEVTLKGRLLIRNICMVFDRHLQQARRLYSEPLRYSRTV